MSKISRNLVDPLTAAGRGLLAGLYDWLERSDDFCEADVAFVHAGAKQRKVIALELYSQGKIRSLIVSMTAREARNFAVLTWPIPLKTVEAALSKAGFGQHAFVVLEASKVTVERVPLGVFGTWGEVRRLGNWLNEHPGISSVLIVSTAPHLRRVRMCCRAILPTNLTVRLFAIPAYGYWDRNKWWSLGRTRVAVFSELPKLLLYLPLTLTRLRRE